MYMLFKHHNFCTFYVYLDAHFNRKVHSFQVDKSDVTRTTSVLDQAIDNLNGNRLGSLDFSLSNRQLSWVYDSLKGYDTSFSAMLENPFIFPQFKEEKTICNNSSDEKSGDRRRLGSNRRGMIDKARSKSAAYPSYDAVKQICPMPMTPEAARRGSATASLTVLDK